MDSTGINSLPTEGQRAIIVGTENMGSAVDLTVSTPPNTMERVREKLEKLLPNAGNFHTLIRCVDGEPFLNDKSGKKGKCSTRGKDGGHDEVIGAGASEFETTGYPKQWVRVHGPASLVEEKPIDFHNPQVGLQGQEFTNFSSLPREARIMVLVSSLPDAAVKRLVLSSKKDLNPEDGGTPILEVTATIKGGSNPSTNHPYALLYTSKETRQVFLENYQPIRIMGNGGDENTILVCGENGDEVVRLKSKHYGFVNIHKDNLIVSLREERRLRDLGGVADFSQLTHLTITEGSAKNGLPYFATACPKLRSLTFMVGIAPGNPFASTGEVVLVKLDPERLQAMEHEILNNRPVGARIRPSIIPKAQKLAAHAENIKRIFKEFRDSSSGRVFVADLNVGILGLRRYTKLEPAALIPKSATCYGGKYCIYTTEIPKGPKVTLVKDIPFEFTSLGLGDDNGQTREDGLL